MKNQIGILVFSLLIFVTVLVIVERSFSPPFQQCVGAATDHNQTDAEKKQNAAGGSSVYRYVRCTGEFLDNSEGTITAIATIIIAAFTCTLWIATSQQARFAREAFVADKRAFIFASGVVGFFEPDAATGQFNWRMSVQWQNSGETQSVGDLPLSFSSTGS